MTNTQRPSYTLIELLVVIAIMGILSSIGVVTINVRRAQAQNNDRVAGAKTIQTAMERYYQKNGKYPYPTLPSTCVTDDTNEPSCNITSCDNNNIHPGNPPSCTFAGVRSECITTYDTTWNGLRSYLAPYLQGALPNDPFDLSTEANKEHSWTLRVSGPEDRNQHYLLTVPLDSVGGESILKQPDALQGVLDGQYNPYGSNTHAGAIFFSDTSGSSGDQSLTCQAVGNNNAWQDGLICGTFFAHTPYPDGPMKKFNVLCLGNMWKAPTPLDHVCGTRDGDGDNCGTYPDQRGYLAKKRCLSFNAVYPNGKCCPDGNACDPAF